MSGGEITLKLDARAERRLKDVADQAGLSVEVLAADLLTEALLADDDWSVDDRIAADAERSGVTYSVEEGMAVFDAAMASHLAKRSR